MAVPSILAKITGLIWPAVTCPETFVDMRASLFLFMRRMRDETISVAFVCPAYNLLSKYYPKARFNLRLNKLDSLNSPKAISTIFRHESDSNWVSRNCQEHLSLVFDSYICYTQHVPFKDNCRCRLIAPTADSSALGGYSDTLHCPFNNKVE